MLTNNNRIAHRKKITVVTLLFALVLVGLFGRLVYLMVWRADYYAGKAVELHERERSIKAARGRILDRNGVVIADNRTVCTVSVIHNQIEDPETVVQVLCRELGLSKEFVTPIRNLSADPMSFEKAFRLPALYFLRQLDRVVLRHSFKQRFEDDPFGTVRNILHCRKNFDAVIFQCFAVDRHFIFVAGKAVELIHEDIIARARRTSFKHSLKVFPIVVRTRHGAVNVVVEDLDIVPFGIVVADMDLPLDGLLGLPLAGIAGIYERRLTRTFRGGCCPSLIASHDVLRLFSVVG